MAVTVAGTLSFVSPFPRSAANVLPRPAVLPSFTAFAPATTVCSTFPVESTITVAGDVPSWSSSAGRPSANFWIAVPLYETVPVGLKSVHEATVDAGTRISTVFPLPPRMLVVVVVAVFVADAAAFLAAPP